ncbi:MAG: substrate-binding domain-containing protein [Parolsenella sp.]|uniref:substrate-binding domain-containing protein n=1 Tax=Parolsenella sp. TaxID=2083006 RepID=UPI002A7591A0|nr:substrate-binding domain-containing protein [Parolsenella sp.]MCI5950296.1 substrate-binding domain-containing protein [Coriobacteriaceae bacterium]MDY3292270.1 substrate-binding domain-containing protein [Parolsenella sp.]
MAKQNVTPHMISRRNFLKGAGILGLGVFGVASLSGCAPDSSSAAGGSASGTTVSVLTYNGNSPYCYLDDAGNLVGYDVDVLKAVDEKLDDYSFSIDSMDFNAMITACESGSAELVSCQLVPNEDRKAKFIFCEEPFCLSPMVFATADPNCKTLDDMAGKSTIATPGGYEYGMLQAYNEKYPDKALTFETVSSLTMADAFKMISSGQVDSFLCYDGTFDAVNEEVGAGLYKTDVVMCESTYFMFNKDQTELRDAVDGVLKEMKSDGSLAKIAEQDLGTDVFSAYGDALSDNELVA